MRRTRRRGAADMSKPKHARGLPETEAQCIVSNLRISPRKLNLVAAMIRNLPAERAVATLTFSKRRIHARGRGRAARVEKWFSHLKIVVAERAQDDIAERAQDDIAQAGAGTE